MNILPVILSMSVSGAAVILLIILIRQTAFKWLNKRTLAALWLIAALKLLIPFNQCTNALVNANLDGSSYPVSVEERAVFSNPINITLERGFVDIAVYVWLFGAVFTASLAVFTHVINRRRYACSLPCGYDISELKKAYGIKRRVRLRISDRTDAPFTYGVFAPVIILPKSMTEENIKNVLCHELAHIKRYDVLFRALLTVCMAVHWFNPLVWVMLRLSAGDMELACDESALLRGKAVPADYALTLIGMEERRSPVPSLGFAGGSLEQRIKEIMRRDNTVGSGAAGAFAAALSIAAAIFVNAAVVSFDMTNNAAVTEATYIIDESVSEVAEDVYYGIEVQQAAEADAAEEYAVYYTVTDNDGVISEHAYYGHEAEAAAESAAEEIWLYSGTADLAEAYIVPDGAETSKDVLITVSESAATDSVYSTVMVGQ